eukprot:COSAG01_NODE_18095_length_1101_cov_1.375250_1_plen_36_part_10
MDFFIRAKQGSGLVPILGIHPEGTLRTFCVLHKGGL